MDIPKILLDKATEIENILKEKCPEAAPFFKRCFLNTIETTVTQLEDGSFFEINIPKLKELTIKLKAPLFISEGEEIVITTRDGKYFSRG